MTHRVVALFAAVLWAALAFATDGVLAVSTDADPVPAGIGPYYGVIGFVVAGVLYWVVLAPTLAARSPLPGAALSAGVVYLGFLAAALPWGIGLVASQALSPFLLAGALAAAVVTVATWAVIRVDASRRDRR